MLMCGCDFMLLTDHMPLTSILSPSKVMLPVAAARPQRWALMLAPHNYVIQYRKAAEHGNAGGISRLPLQVVHKEKPDTAVRIMVHHLEIIPVDSADIKKGTGALHSGGYGCVRAVCRDRHTK